MGYFIVDTPQEAEEFRRLMKQKFNVILMGQPIHAIENGELKQKYCFTKIVQEEDLKQYEGQLEAFMRNKLKEMR